MTKTVHSALSRIFREHIIALRQNANMTQRDLAKALKRDRGLVARIELGERRVDFVELHEVFLALGADPETEAAALMRKFNEAVVTTKRK
ncbi:MAG: helix-turn-helix transcriptional regulator [Chthoniobacteraceae bacterium]